MHFLSKVRQTSWIGVMKMFIKVRNRSPVVFHEDIIAVLNDKSLNLTRKTTNNNLFEFSKF